MKKFDVQAVEIEAPKDDVFAFIREPENLPKWAQAFSRADSSGAHLSTPAGQVNVHLCTTSDRDTGVVDWRLVFPDGGVALAQSRVTETTRGACIYSFVLHAPPVPLEEVEGALVEQSRQLTQELATLKRLVES